MNLLISQSKVIVCVGTGGVGKTTIAACLGIQAAKSGKKVLVLTIDPARRLAQALGITSSKYGENLVPRQNYKGQLYAGIINEYQAFKEFIFENAKDDKEAEKIISNSLFQQLSTNLSGSQEFTSLTKLYSCVESQKFDLIILDTPPAQNAMDFFTSPEKIYALFQKSITKWFSNETTEQNVIKKIISKGTFTVFSAFKKLTGAQFIGELADFFTSIQSIQEVISQRSLDVHELLIQKSTQFVLVTSQDKIKLIEAEVIYKDLVRLGFNLQAIIVNRCFNEKFIIEDELKDFYSELTLFYKSANEKINELKKVIQNGILIDKVYEDSNDLVGLEELETLSDKLFKDSFTEAVR